MSKNKNRGNGQGSVYKCGKTWIAEITVKYTDEGVRKMIRKKGFKTKTEAINYLPKLSSSPKIANKSITFGKIAELTIENHEKNNVTKSTIDCYKAALKYFDSLDHFKFADIGIDDLQGCIDDCPKGKRTQQNMKAACGLVYKYAIPRKYLDFQVNLAQYLRINAEGGCKKAPFTPDEIEIFRQNIGLVPYADYLYAMCYLGFRPSEALSLTVNNYDPVERAFTGGAKTEAGKNRIVTISPKIQHIIDSLVSTTCDGYIFHKNGFRMGLKTFREDCFYPALLQMGIPNDDPKRTPHSCRHTFADLLKHAVGDKDDKLDLIGHSSEEMLKYYQSVNYEDLRRITDSL